MPLSHYNHFDAQCAPSHIDVLAPHVDWCAPSSHIDVCAPTTHLDVCLPTTHIDVCAPTTHIDYVAPAHVDIIQPVQQFTTLRTVTYVPQTTWVTMSRRRARKLGY